MDTRYGLEQLDWDMERLDRPSILTMLVRSKSITRQLIDEANTL